MGCIRNVCWCGVVRIFDYLHSTHNMVTFTHLFLAATNIFGIFPILKADGIFERCLVISTVFASVAMHLSETKHKLKPNVIIANKADLFLNMDRGAAIVCMLYFLPKWWYHAERGRVAALFVGGLLFSGAGELVQNLPVYIACHTMWHLIAYSTMYHLLVD